MSHCVGRKTTATPPHLRGHPAVYLDAEARNLRRWPRIDVAAPTPERDDMVAPAAVRP